MTPEEWHRVRPILESALELDSANRRAFLNEACADPSLRREVESLIDAHEQADTWVLNSLSVLGLGVEEGARFRLLPGKRVGPYEILEELALGGMGAVYRAVRADGEYKQQVALKIVRADFGADSTAKRFRNERQILASLDHHNIAKILDGGTTTDGLPYFVMEFIDGLPITDYCDRHKLTIDARLTIFRTVCSAVHHAHQHLVIHRDLKPSNILVLEDGSPKLLDFGIAKVLNPEPSNQNWLATQTGLPCMTPAYASPEQARGKSVSRETDVYSLGVVLYELLTGHRPYRLTQHSPAEIERAICEQEPETPSTAVSRVENDTSPGGKPITKTPELVSLTREGEPDKLRRRLRGDLDNIVLKALQKEPQHRYGSVAEFSQDIDRHLQHQPVKARPRTFAYRASKFVRRHRTEVSAAFAVVLATFAAASFAFNPAGIRNRLGIGSSQAKIRSLAVIPLVNISDDPSQEYVSDGLTDTLIEDLEKIGSLKVISRTSSMEYKQTKKTLPEIAHELDVDGIIEGTVQRSGDRVRINANLTQAATDKRVWARSYEHDMRDVFMLEREVAEDVARQVQARITTEEQAQLAQRGPANLHALDAYLRGNYYLTRSQSSLSDDERRTTAQYFQQAIDADSNFVPAYIGLANAHAEMARGSPEDTAIRKKAAEKALKLDPTSSEAWGILGHIKWYAFDWSGAEEDYRRAVSLSPHHASYGCNFGMLLGAMGRLDEALKEGEISQELDPNEDNLSLVLEMRGEHKRAIELLQRMVQLHPSDSGNHIGLFRNYAETGRYEEALQELESFFTLMGLPETAADMQRAFTVSGYAGAMREFAKDLENLSAGDKGFVPENLAYAYLASGDKDRAFYWLDQAFEHRENVSMDWGLTIIKEDRLFDPLRSDPRFKDLLRRVGLPP